MTPDLPLLHAIDPLEDDAADLRPIIPYVGRDDRQQPALLGARCGDCAEISIGRPRICARCGARNRMAPITLGHTGRLYNYTTVHRSLAGVAVPFVFAIVDLDGGGTVKGTIVADDSALAFDLPVRVVFDRVDAPQFGGRSYLSYHFVPAPGIA